MYGPPVTTITAETDLNYTDTTSVQLLILGRYGVRPADLNSTKARIRRTARKHGTTAHVSHTGGGSSLFVRLEATR